MLFLEPWFWVFAGVAIPAYWACPRKLKLYWLLAASAVFHYHFAGPAGMAPIIALATMTYFTGLALSAGAVLRAFSIACTLLVGALSFYKYSGFVLGNLTALMGAIHAGAPAWMAHWQKPAAPLAISFFTFEFVHYLYEIRVKGREPVRNPFHFGVFAIFFPTLACGPIKRFPDFVPQLAELRTPPAGEVYRGAQRVIRGLFKKVCLADLSMEYVKVLEALPHFTAPAVALLAVMQGFRIYYDFCGYSDIAIGLAQMLGLKVPENFNRPYFSTSLREFWRRWHMSLSFWIRDYIYIPLGGNRVRRGFNLFAAMLLCGLWHGAAWNFALWGVYHGVGLGLEVAVQRRFPNLFNESWPQRLLGWAICYVYVAYGWLLFFYPLGTVLRMTREGLLWCYAF